jgi:hypothetical protein
LASLLLGACASAPSVDVDRAAATGIKRIAILGIHEPKGVEVVNLGGVAAGFGLVGGLIQGATNADHSKTFVAALRLRKPTLSDEMLRAITLALRDDGFEVTVAADQKPKLAADGKSDDYSDIHVDADAILSVWFGVVGYMSPPRSSQYEPWVMIKARLLDAKTKKDIYYKTFCVGYKMRIENSVALPADPKYQYDSFDELMAHVSDAAAGLVDCEEITAKRIGADLKTQ